MVLRSPGLCLCSCHQLLASDSRVARWNLPTSQLRTYSRPLRVACLFLCSLTLCCRRYCCLHSWCGKCVSANHRLPSPMPTGLRPCLRLCSRLRLGPCLRLCPCSRLCLGPCLRLHTSLRLRPCAGLCLGPCLCLPGHRQIRICCKQSGNGGRLASTWVSASDMSPPSDISSGVQHTITQREPCFHPGT